MSNIYIFGRGKVGRQIYDYFKDSICISGFLDNDSKNIDYETVFPVENTASYEDYIIIGSTKFYDEMYAQLMVMGFNPEFICGFGISDVFTYFQGKGLLNIQNFIKSKAKSTCHKDNELAKNIQNTLLNNEVMKNTKQTKILFFLPLEYNENFVQPIIDHLYNCTDFKIDIFQIPGEQAYNNSHFTHIYERDDMGIFLSLVESYDIIHFKYIFQFYYNIIDKLREKSKTLIATIWGSDFYRVDPNSVRNYRHIYKNCDYITTPNKKTIRQFIERYGHEFSKKMRLVKYGIDFFDIIDELSARKTKDDIKEILGIPKDKIIIVYGRSAILEHQHAEFISQINKLNNKIRNNIFIILMMTYPLNTENYTNFVREKIEKTGIPYKIFDSYVSKEKLAGIRIVTDIHINLMTTDTFGGAFQESLYAKSVCLTGAWLPYDEFIEYGCYYNTIDDFPELPDKLSYLCNNLEQEKDKCLNNKGIKAVSEINACNNKWLDLYLGKLPPNYE